MSVRSLIEHYANGTHLHVRVRDIRDYMVSGELAIKDRIRFVGVEIDINVLRGFLHQYTKRPLDGSALRPMACADVHYDRRQPIEWQRLVCCKELLHLLDPQGHRTNTPAHVKLQIERIALPPGMETIRTDGMRVWGDRLADLQAIALLFPMEARRVLVGKVDKIGPDNIARLVRLPEKYVRWVMSPQWEDMYPTILQLP
jgi:hypothetical protein